MVNKEKTQNLLRIYTALYPYRVGFKWAFIFLGAILVTVLAYVGWQEKFIAAAWLLAALLLLMICVGRYAYHYLKMLLEFSEFKKWPQKLPYKLEGWEKLLQARNMRWFWFWRLQCEVHIHYKKPADKNQKAMLETAVLGFIKKTERHFYISDGSISGFANDPRQDWCFETDTIRGSVNNRVVGEIYFFLKDKIAALAKKYNNISMVTIDVSSEEYKIEPPHYDGASIAS